MRLIDADALKEEVNKNVVGRFNKLLSLLIDNAPTIVEADDPINDPHYGECEYCKYWECLSVDYPCCACGSAGEFQSKWERVE